MKFSPDLDARGTQFELTDELRCVLNILRHADQFDVKQFVDAKTRVLTRYLKAHALKSCVVGVSGGVDSALVLALAVHASRQPGTPIEEVVPVLLPVYDPEAATNQSIATARGVELCHNMGLRPVTVDLTAAHKATQGAVDSAMGVAGQPWASGQLVSYQRTPALYYVTSLQTQKGRPGVLLGTTNYDEGAYLGYFGKASDGLVDVQLISDLHKHRVFEAARYLGVPSSILGATPTGDMYDGRVDEDVFGASYDFVELFLRIKRQPAWNLGLIAGLGPLSRQQFALQSANLEALHGYNRHKYLGASPAVHLDLQPMSFPGSWKYQVWND